MSDVADVQLSERREYPIAGAKMSVARIVPGGEYFYDNDIPKGCKGQRYKVHRMVVDVPSYQSKVLVEALTGKDAGKWFVVSPANFCVRYIPVAETNASER